VAEDVRMGVHWELAQLVVPEQVEHPAVAVIMAVERAREEAVAAARAMPSSRQPRPLLLLR
jgi:hypothetical protein